jgi:hypothetical protein
MSKIDTEGAYSAEKEIVKKVARGPESPVNKGGTTVSK